MLEFSFFGHNFFRIKGKNSSTVVDPFNPADFNLTKFRTFADVVIVTCRSSNYHNFSALVEGANGKQAFIINGPGEYEFEGVAVTGVSAESKEPEEGDLAEITIYQMLIDNISIANFGNLGKKLSQSQVEALGNIDIAIVPVGGKYSIDAKEAVEVIAQIEPKIIIPCHYKTKNENLALLGIDLFLNQMGTKNTITVDKLSISQDKLPEETEIVILKESV